MPDEQLQSRATLAQAADEAAWQVHQITNRTDQSVEEIAKLHPHHEAVVKWREAKVRLSTALLDNL